MKAIKIIAILIVLTSVFLTGCQSAEPTAKAGLEDSAYPLDEA
jgi:PBP1b-binding outer membrane lipoprotein LpoB